MNKYFYFILYIFIYYILVTQSWIFSIITPVFIVTWSFRNHSNMLICCSCNIYDYYQCRKQLLLNIFVEIVSSEFFGEYKVQKPHDKASISFQNNHLLSKTGKMASLWRQKPKFMNPFHSKSICCYFLAEHKIRCIFMQLFSILTTSVKLQKGQKAAKTIWNLIAWWLHQA